MTVGQTLTAGAGRPAVVEANPPGACPPGYELRDQIGAGWNWHNEPTEPDVDALRGRADFQKLFAEVEAKVEKSAAKVP